MTGLINLPGIPHLPYDVLRLVFEEATREDTRKAVKYTLISKVVRTWVEICLYDNVQLYRENPLRNFLRTLESSTKSRRFFATRVKSLSIVYDSHDVDRATKILSICTGVQNLTMWAISAQATEQNATAQPFDYYPHQALRTQHEFSAQPPVVTTPYHHPRLCALLHTLAHHLRPNRLSILIHKPVLIPITTQIPQQKFIITRSSPDFSLAIFSHLTHLLIVNRWTEWSDWAWSWTNIVPSTDTIIQPQNPSKFLPNLTHLSLDIQVGKRTPLKDPPLSPVIAPSAIQRRNRRLPERIGRTLAQILTSPELNPHLRVLLCIISFDDTPSPTARKIKEETTRNLLVFLSELGSLRTITSGAIKATDSRLGDVRLVFSYDREPFREREAGSAKMWNMWKRAEEIVRLQTQGYVHTGGENYDPIIFEL